MSEPSTSSTRPDSSSWTVNRGLANRRRSIGLLQRHSFERMPPVFGALNNNSVSFRSPKRMPRVLSQASKRRLMRLLQILTASSRSRLAARQQTASNDGFKSVIVSGQSTVSSAVSSRISLLNWASMACRASATVHNSHFFRSGVWRQYGMTRRMLMP
jgi:hypothetical protein